MQGKLLFGQKRREMSNKGIVRGGGEGCMHPLLPHRYFIFGSDVKLCIETLTDPDLLEVVSRWSGCVMPKIKCRASILANN